MLVNALTISLYRVNTLNGDCNSITTMLNLYFEDITSAIQSRNKRRPKPHDVHALA
jgi:hypothetical protein